VNRKVASLYRLEGFSEIKENLQYWLSKPPQERIEAVDFLRNQINGNTERLQRVARVIHNGIKKTKTPASFDFAQDKLTGVFFFIYSVNLCKSASLFLLRQI